MKRAVSLLFILSVFSLLLSSCEQRGDFLSYQGVAFSADAVYASPEGSFSGKMTKEKDGSLAFSFSSPSEIQGFSLLLSADGRYFLSFEGMREEVSDRAKEMLAPFSLLSLTPTGRMRYTEEGAVFQTEKGEATVQKEASGAPASILLKGASGTLSLSLSDWQVIE